MMNGGYLMVSKTDTNLYEKLNNALTLGKPVLFYEDENTCYYIDTITKSGTDIVLTKGGKTITIESDGDITEVGNILSNKIEDITDANGNLRFIEGDLAVKTIEGITFKYAKWSLSGTHLMIVLAGEIADTTALINGTTLADIFVPSYILDKVYSLWSSGYVNLQQNGFIADDWTIQNVSVVLAKDTIKLFIGVAGNVTMTADRSFRIQFDLLIDNE